MRQDLGSILTFLRICRPLDNEDFFKRMVLRPLKDGDPSGAELLRVCLMSLAQSLPLMSLQALMSHICIRRTKEVSSLCHVRGFECRFTVNRCKTKMESLLCLYHQSR